MKKNPRVRWVAALALVLLTCGKAACGGSTNVLSVCDEPSLRAAIAAGGWISVTCNGTVTLANSISISNSVILDATGVSFGISGSNAVRILYVAPGAEFSATNLTLANGSCIITTNVPGINADAGAIYNDGGAVTLVSCTVTNNSAQALIYGGLARGGAIFNNAGTVALCQCAIENNLALGGGTDDPQPSLNTVTFVDTALGGAIYNTNGTVALSGCTLSSNVCSDMVLHDYLNLGNGVAMGGAAYQSGGTMLVTNSGFAMNQAAGGAGPNAGVTVGSPAYGGALAVAGGMLTLDHSRFWMNQAAGGEAPAGTIEAGFSGSAYGGAIYCLGNWKVADCSFFGNGSLAGERGSFKGGGGFGGAIYNGGDLEFDRCSVCSNYCQGGAGVIYNSGESSDGGDALGGGILNTGQIAATNCTVALNAAAAGAGSGYNPDRSSNVGIDGNAIGGGVFNNTNATFVAMNITIASNACSSPSGNNATNGLVVGSEIANTNGTLRLHNTIIAYGGTNGNAYGVITDDGYNLSSDGTADLSGSGSLNNADPKLGPLANYGGPTCCMALRYDSPAIDAGDSSGAPPTDQRGAIRPNGNGVDIGAYEFYSNQIDVPVLSLASVTNTVVIRFPAYPSGLYHLQTSSNLITWTDLDTLGPFGGATNVSRIVCLQNGVVGFYRLSLP